VCDHDADACWPVHGCGLAGARVRCEQDGSSVDQAIALVRVDQPRIIGQHALDLIDELSVIVAEEAECKRFVTVEPHIRNQRDHDGLAVVQDGGWAAPPLRAVLLFERLIGVIDQHEPEGEDAQRVSCCNGVNSATCEYGCLVHIRSRQ